MMSRDEIRQQMQRALTPLVASFSSTEIDDRHREILNDFIENYEFGVGLEWLISLISERQIRLTQDQKSDIQRLALQMGVDISRSLNGMGPNC